MFDDDTYQFKREGVVHTVVRGREEPGFELEVTVAFAPDGSGRADFKDGAAYNLSRTLPEDRRWDVLRGTDDVLATFEVHRPRSEHNASVSLQKELSSDVHLPILLVLTWFIAIQEVRDRVTVGAAAT